jgi:hypothetical protein
MDAAARQKACKPSFEEETSRSRPQSPSSRAGLSGTSEISMAQDFNLHLTGNYLEDSCADLFNYFALK